MEAVHGNPDQQAGQRIADDLRSVAARAPTDVAKRIEDLAVATISASSVPQGFAAQSPTEQHFVLAGQELTVVCQPDGPDLNPTREAPPDDSEVATP
jgi:hypothetical protein